MQENNTKIYYKLYQLTKRFYGIVKNFDREYKYTIGKDMIDLLWRCLDLSIEANFSPNKDKKAMISELDSAYQKFKTRVRMSQEIKLLSASQFASLEEEYMLEIGKMIGGWKKWAVV